MSVWVSSRDPYWADRIDGKYTVRRVDTGNCRAWLCGGRVSGADLKIYETRDPERQDASVCKLLLESEYDSDGRSTWNERERRYAWCKLTIDLCFWTNL